MRLRERQFDVRWRREEVMEAEEEVEGKDKGEGRRGGKRWRREVEEEVEDEREIYEGEGDGGLG